MYPRKEDAKEREEQKKKEQNLKVLKEKEDLKWVDNDKLVNRKLDRKVC